MNGAAQAWRDWTLTLKNLLLPIFCKECGLRLLTEENGFFCPTCWERSPRIRRPFCSLCGRPHTQGAGLGVRSNFPCAQCRERPIPHVRRVFGAAHYDAAVASAVKLFKFHDKPRLAGPLGELLAAFLREEVDTAVYDAVTPVPLYRVRERERGYNQSLLLAQAILPLCPGATLDTSLQRIRPTQTQSRLKGPKQRRDNVRGAFAVIGDTFQGKTVLLVDDVVTTGETIAECGRALGRAGAAAVDVAAVALATPPTW